MTRGFLFLLIVFLTGFGSAAPRAFAVPSETDWQHGLGYFGVLEYQPGFDHFRWVNPGAPKGGRMVLPARQRYTSFNPIVTKGTPAAGVYVGGDQLLYDSLLQSAGDEVGSAYGRLAEAVWLAEDYSEVWFRLRKEARFHDGVPITARDVAFTFEMIKEHGAPSIKSDFTEVVAAEVIDDHTIRFVFSPYAQDNAHLALRVGDLYALPRHHWQDRNFAAEALTPPLGSGPYRIGDFIAGRSIEWHRVDDYWGRDLPVNRGRFNFDVLRYEYFLDIYVAREAVRSGDVDIIQDTIATTWVTAWNVPAVEEGRLLKYPADVKRPYGAGWVAFLFNVRAGKFQDRRVREALWLCRDFPWFNEIQEFGVNERAESHFTGTPFESTGMPSPAELELLAPLRAQVPPEVFTRVYESPPSVIEGKRRDYLIRADALLREAGWVLRDGERVNERTGERFVVDFPFGNALGMKIANLFVYNLGQLGIEVKLRQMESSRYLYMLREGDFDITLTTVISGLIPGADLRNRYHSSTANMLWSTNWGGIADPAVDKLIEAVEQAKSMDEHFAAVRALDRVLLWNYYMIPGFYPPNVFLVHWNRFGRPEYQGAYDIGYPNSWWFDADKAASIEAGEKLAIPPDPVLTGDVLYRRSQAVNESVTHLNRKESGGTAR